MKKRYNKPEILNMETICPDQAIAGCSKSPGKGTVVPLGWANSYARQGDSSGKFWATKDAAEAANPGSVGCEVFLIYHGTPEQESTIYEDFPNTDGIYGGIDHSLSWSLSHEDCSCVSAYQDNLQEVKAGDQYLFDRFLS